MLSSKYFGDKLKELVNDKNSLSEYQMDELQTKALLGIAYALNKWVETHE